MRLFCTLSLSCIAQTSVSVSIARDRLHSPETSSTTCQWPLNSDGDADGDVDGDASSESSSTGTEAEAAEMCAYAYSRLNTNWSGDADARVCPARGTRLTCCRTRGSETSSE